MVILSASDWRRQWRFRGWAVDRLFPKLYDLPAPRARDLPGLVTRNAVISGCGRCQLVEDDAKLVAEVATDLAGYIAEHLPMQVVATDPKGFMPKAASGLAVRNVGGESEYMGSFDALLRVTAGAGGVWRPYHQHEIALDIKITGASSCLGLNGVTMRAYLAHGRALMMASKRDKTRLGECRAVAFLLRRPPGRTIEGRHHAGAIGFCAVDTDTLLEWDPKTARQAPGIIVMSGGLLQRAATEEPLALLPPPPPAVPMAHNRWNDLTPLQVRPGYVTAQDFCTVFNIGVGNIKKGAERVLKRLRDDGYGGNLQDWHKPGSGASRPFKVARVSDLKHSYPTLK